VRSGEAAQRRRLRDPQNNRPAENVRDLLNELVQRYPLEPDGIHGVGHWARVLENGRRLAEKTGAMIEVVELFALFHDSQRQNDGHDLGHGSRGARLAEKMRGKWFDLSDMAFDHLIDACALHTNGFVDADITVQTCWDADRLDLGRVGIVPDRDRLCTAAARDPNILRWANERARSEFVPDWVPDIGIVVR